MSFKPTIKDTPRQSWLRIRMTADELATVHDRAKALGITSSDLVRRLLGMPTANVSEARRDESRSRRKPAPAPSQPKTPPAPAKPVSEPPAATTVLAPAPAPAATLPVTGGVPWLGQ
jgi:hypothetical protein